MTEEHVVAVLKDREEIRLLKVAEKVNVTKKRKLFDARNPKKHFMKM